MSGKKAQSAGARLQDLIKASAEGLEDRGLELEQTSPFFSLLRWLGGGQAVVRILKAGMLDFVGHYRGAFVTFDAKSTVNKTSFPLENVEKHQFKRIERHTKRGAAAFLLVEFSSLGRFFLVGYDLLGPYWIEANRIGSGARQSIPFADFVTRAIEVEAKGGRLDLLPALEAALMKARLTHGAPQN